MALPTMAEINTAVDDLYAAFADRKTRVGGRQATSLIARVANLVSNAYVVDVTVTVTDATDAGVSEFIAAGGELGVALGKAGSVGVIFQVTGAGDLTDDALATAKGEAPADEDIFQVTGADAVTYIGAVGDFDFADEEVEDFVSLGS